MDESPAATSGDDGELPCKACTGAHRRPHTCAEGVARKKIGRAAWAATSQKNDPAEELVYVAKAEPILHQATMTQPMASPPATQRAEEPLLYQACAEPVGIGGAAASLNEGPAEEGEGRPGAHPGPLAEARTIKSPPGDTSPAEPRRSDSSPIASSPIAVHPAAGAGLSATPRVKKVRSPREGLLGTGAGSGTSCHYCRQKREIVFNCPRQDKKGGHRWCVAAAACWGDLCRGEGSWPQKRGRAPSPVEGTAYPPLTFVVLITRCELCLSTHFGTTVAELKADPGGIWPNGCVCMPSR